MYCDHKKSRGEQCEPVRRKNMKTRKNIRLQEYDYSTKGLYFITICTNQMKDLFGQIIDDEVVLNEKGNIVKKIIEEYNLKSEDVKNDYYQIMPKHLHIIIELLNDNKVSLSNVVSGIKGKITKELHAHNIWQKSYYERIIRNEKEYVNIVEYIVNNPYRGKYNW